LRSTSSAPITGAPADNGNWQVFNVAQVGQHESG
jgi:hypothetical protein